ncbi:cytochrome c3 family protein [Caldithrix abyssi]
MKKHILFLVVIFFIYPLLAENDVCLECHSDPELTTERGGEEVSLFVNENIFATSVHGDLECVSCHADADVEEFPHPERLSSPHCGDCHDTEQEKYDIGFHGKAFARGDRYAPSCWECHGTHDIYPETDVRSRVFKMNIPLLCGRCHREGAPVARIYKIPEHNILENYSQSIHGEGLFKKGLIVTAACADCHDAHQILPHTDPRSSIAP